MYMCKMGDFQMVPFWFGAHIVTQSLIWLFIVCINDSCSG